MTYAYNRKKKNRKNAKKKPKFNRRAFINKLRTEYSRLIHIRDNNTCQKCGGQGDRLNTSHIYPKGAYPSMQFLPENSKLLCFRCHLFFWHRDPIEAQKWIREYLGLEKYDKLRERSQITVSVNEVFLKQTEIKLKEFECTLGY